ncbi:SatD family protein [Myceligenerans indicum]|uniref:RNA polymerase subunit sigma-70 n=1 Tax=Myceligenerans indicum TaxID=2593663 RepID=A0ABS1LQV2_9MICO|nr:SatD family protein [Myceligenerans indicum]MBL0888657.1 RNA polymerase subunit sigma-70 [Myceligenerans indicum]
MFTLIGDLIGSREAPDRAALQRRVGQILDQVNEAIDTMQLLEPTVGDEIQGGFATIGDATLATLVIRLELAPDADMRFGLGYGDVTVHDGDRRPLLQDGPGWWAAREAIETLKGKRGTLYVGPQDGDDTPDPAFVNAFLLARDALVATLNARQHRMLLLALKGQSQRAIAEAEGITESAVSQAFARGVRAAHDAQITFGKAG